MRILIAENDAALGAFLQQGFQTERYIVDLTDDGQRAAALAGSISYDAAILDLNLAQHGGIDLLRSVRAKRELLPILVLANATGPQERAEVLDAGADDLVLKPFALSELSARVRALLRRGSRSAEAILCVEDLELSRVERTVKRAGRSIELTPKEFALLEYLMRNSGERVTRAQIVRHVWNLSFDTMTNVVDVYINYLRKKVDSSSEHKLIHTVRGVGYQLRAHDTARPVASRAVAAS